MREQGQRPPRVETAFEAVLVDSDGGELTVKVVDLSSGGFRLHAPEVLVAGERVTLRVSRYGDFAAEILWADGHRAGGRFLAPVTL